MVLRGVSVQIRQGEVVAIVGGSGCGKTVLLNEILGLLEADQGRVLAANHNKDLLSRLRPRTVMLHDGLIFFDGPFEDFSASDSPTIRPYFDIMPILHRRAEAAESSAIPG